MKKPTPVSAKPAKGAPAAEGTATGQVAEKGKANAVTTQIPPSQIEIFDAAMKLFHERDFSAARTLFEQAADGPTRDVTHAARQHLQMCNQRIARSQPELRTTEDLYHFAVGLIIERRAAEADEYLRRALEQAPDADHVHYALAISRGLQGDLADAAKHMEQAIRLEPKNRLAARTDPDFLEFGRRSPLRELVFGERKESN